MEVSIIVETLGFSRNQINGFLKQYMEEGFTPISLGGNDLKYGAFENCQQHEHGLYHICLEHTNPTSKTLDDAVKLIDDEYMYVALVVDKEIVFDVHYQSNEKGTKTFDEAFEFLRKY